MPRFSSSSKLKLATAHIDLQHLFNEVVKHYDCTILIGERDLEAQNKAYASGHSQVMYPFSKHNQAPSLAVDVAPYPIEWKNLRRFYHFGGYVLGVAKTMGIDIRMGMDWDGDLRFNDQKFNDLVHFEVKI